MNRRRILSIGVALAAAVACATALSPPAALAAPSTLVVSNPAPINVPDNTPAGTSSQIVVAGQTGLVTDLDVTLNALTSTYPDDLYIMLIGPNGRRVMLMSDACGGDDVANLSFRIDDEASAPAPNYGPCSSGSYIPYNTEDEDDAPFLPSAPALSAFDGASPNGTWTLILCDQSDLDVSSLVGGFTLTFQVSDNVAPAVTFKKPKPSTATTQKVVFAASDAGSTFECNLDGVGWNSCTSPAKAKHLKVGKHKLAVRATDPSGNRGAPATVKLTVLPKPKK